MPNPYISATNLSQAITAIRDQVRVELLQGGMPFVETSTFHTLRRFIEKKLRKERVNKWGVIVGPTGTQKTASYKELCQRISGLRWAESNSNCSLRELVMRLARKCGYRGSTTSAAKQAILDAMASPLSSSESKGIIVDNMQEMVRREMDGKRLKDKQTAYEFFREVQDETGCAIIWSITPESEDDMFDAKSIYFEQFEGRAGGRESFLRLANYPPVADLVQIAEAVGFKDAADHKDLLKTIGHARGRIRRFFEILQEARDAADADKAKLTVDYVEAAVEEYKLPQAVLGSNKAA
jgi:DNA transposition AAA+ family ATPase